MSYGGRKTQRRSQSRALPAPRIEFAILATESSIPPPAVRFAASIAFPPVVPDLDWRRGRLRRLSWHGVSHHPPSRRSAPATSHALAHAIPLERHAADRKAWLPLLCEFDFCCTGMSTFNLERVTWLVSWVCSLRSVAAGALCPVSVRWHL